MEPFISNDSFDAFRTENGIEIHEKKTAAKKVAVIISIVGAIFLAIGFIPMEGTTYSWITTLFSAVFFYGGMAMLAMGILTFIVKGTSVAQGQVTIVDKNARLLIVRGKEIPFSEMEPISLQTSDIMNRRLTAMIFRHNGKNKGFTSGGVFTQDVKSLENLAKEVNEMIAS